MTIFAEADEVPLFIRPDVLERPNELDPDGNLLPIHAEQQGERQNPRPSYNRNSPSSAPIHADIVTSLFPGRQKEAQAGTTNDPTIE